MIIAIDFDGTVVTHCYPMIGKDIGAIPVLKRIMAAGHKLILHTMRAGKEEEEALAWLKERGIEVVGVNASPGQGRWTKSKKAYANLYIDDAALGIPSLFDEETGRPYVDWKEVESLLEEKGII